MKHPEQDEESRPRYSSGAAMNIIDHDVGTWERRANFLRTLTGLTHVEVWAEEIALTAAEIAELRRLLKSWRVTVHAPYLQLSMMSHHDVVRGASAEVCRRTLRLAEELGAEVVSFQGGTRPWFMSEAVALEQLAAMFGAMKEAGNKATPTLMNMPSAGERLIVYPASLQDLRHVMERMPDLKATLDVGHCVQNRDNWIAFLRTYAQRIANIHLHDAHAGGQGHLRLGHGAMDAFALARLLRAVGYTGHVTLGTSGQKDTAYSWRLWRRAQAEASGETTATLDANLLSKPDDAADDDDL